MDPSSDLFSDSQYRTEVLQLPSEDAESERDQQLVDEARQLGLKVPEIELIASLTASIASGMVDLSSSPILSSGSSADRQSVGDVTASPSLDQVTSSLFDCTLSSEPIQTGSTRSTASLSTRPTSYSSSEGRPPPDHHRHLPHHHPHHHTSALRLPGHRASVQSAASSDRELRKERRKSSLKSAIGKIHFLKKRSPSSVLLPPAAHITVTKTDDGGVDKVYLESKPDEGPGQGQGEGQSPEGEHHHPTDDNTQVLRLEIPVFDQESLQRSQTNVELRQMREAQKSERNRHLAFHDAAIRRLRDRHQAAVSDQLAEHKQAEEAKREQNHADAARIEERQLSIEIDQEREFERAKINSRTRIKYMEGYFRTSSPPPSTTTEPTSPDAATSPEPIPRKFTPQHKAQLEQEYHAHSSMDQLHSSRIKVLRDRQERRLQDAIARMDRELDALIDAHAVAFANLHRTHQQEETALTRGLDARKARLRHRWNLEEAILRRKLEAQHGEGVLFGPLPPLLFNESPLGGVGGGGVGGEMSRDSAICVTDEEMG